MFLARTVWGLEPISCAGRNQFCACLAGLAPGLMTGWPALTQASHWWKICPILWNQYCTYASETDKLWQCQVYLFYHFGLLSLCWVAPNQRYHKTGFDISSSVIVNEFGRVIILLGRRERVAKLHFFLASETPFPRYGSAKFSNVLFYLCPCRMRTLLVRSLSLIDKRLHHYSLV